MRCDKVLKLISLYIDGKLNKQQEKEVREHINQCDDCINKYENIAEIIKNCNEIEEVDLPKNFHSKLRSRLEKEAATYKANNRFVNAVTSINKDMNWKRYGAVAAVLIFGIMIFSMSQNIDLRMGSSDEQMATEMPRDTSYKGENAPASDNALLNSADYDIDMEMAEGQDDATDGGLVNSGDRTVETTGVATWGQSFVTDNRKMIMTASVKMETTDFDDTINSIIGRASFEGGFVQNSEIYNRDDLDSRKWGRMEIKIPKDKFGDFLDKLKEYGAVIEQNTKGEDITLQYFDTESRIKMLRVQEERLIGMLGKVDALNEMILLENELNRIRTDIEKLTGDMNRWDGLIAYSTVMIDINEVKDLDRLGSIDKGLGSRISKAMVKSMNSIIRGFEFLLVLLSALIPYTVFAVLAIWLGRKIYYRFR